MNFSRGHSGTTAQCESCLFSLRKKHQNSQKLGEIHELFVLALSLVWFAGATPDSPTSTLVEKENSAGLFGKFKAGLRTHKQPFRATAARHSRSYLTFATKALPVHLENFKAGNGNKNNSNSTRTGVLGE